MRQLTATDLAEALPMVRAMDVMEGAFRAISTDTVVAPPRQALTLQVGTALLMGAAGAGVGIVAKLVSVMPGNARANLPGTIGSLLLADDATGEPLALIDGTALTALRTAAAAGCAMRLLSRPNAKRAVLFGTGTQGATQLMALDAARDLEEIIVVGRHAGRLDAFVGRHADTVRAPLTAAAPGEAGLEKADIIACATSSHEPLFDASRVPAGCHVSSVGSFRPGMTELSPALAVSASVFVESREAAAAEAGELIAARESGWTEPGDWTEVGEVLAGEKSGRTDAGQVTWYKSVGHAAFDLYAARAAFDTACGKGSEGSAEPGAIAGMGRNKPDGPVHG